MQVRWSLGFKTILALSCGDKNKKIKIGLKMQRLKMQMQRLVHIIDYNFKTVKDKSSLK